VADEILPDGVEYKRNNLDGFVGMLRRANSATDLQYRPSRVYGVDFSGAEKAGTKIWIASATIVRGALKVEDCRQAKDLPGSTAERDQCLRSLRDFISTQKECAFGLDFPFGLPRDLVRENSWEDFVLSFGSIYSGPQEFACISHTAAHGKELWRDTDRKAHAPLSVNNLFLYRQTYYGIRDVLAPLVREQLACVIPMQRKLHGKPWLFEVCPASTLKNIKLYLSPYKGRDMESRVHRERIIEGLEKTGTMLIKSSELRLKILDDWHGDALDSVIAAFATFRALSNPACLSVPGTSAYALEGYIYV
jgi:hypothetical protein